MKKTYLIKIIEIILFLVLISLICSNKVQASEVAVSANNCNVGENLKVTVTIPEDVVAYQFEVTAKYFDGSDYTINKRGYGHNDDFTELFWTGNCSFEIPGKVAGSGTIDINNIVLSNASNQKVNSSDSAGTSFTITDLSPSQPDTTSDNTNNTQPAPAAPVTLNFKDTNEKMYTSRRVNARQNYGTDSNIIQTLAIGTEVIRTGISDGNKDGYSWSRISYNGITGYVITGALTYDAPVQEEPEEKNEDEIKEDDSEKTEEDNQEVQELSDTDEALIASLSEKYGTIPEVGLNIMPFLFLGSCISCLFLNIIVKRNSAL